MLRRSRAVSSLSRLSYLCRHQINAFGMPGVNSNIQVCQGFYQCPQYLFRAFIAEQQRPKAKEQDL